MFNFTSNLFKLKKQTQTLKISRAIIINSKWNAFLTITLSGPEYNYQPKDSSILNFFLTKELCRNFTLFSAVRPHKAGVAQIIMCIQLFSKRLNHHNLNIIKNVALYQ